VQYWKYDEDKADTALRRSCLQVFLEHFDRVIAACDMQDIPQDLMEAALKVTISTSAVKWKFAKQ
jgi:nitrate reductase beta subunit